MDAKRRPKVIGSAAAATLGPLGLRILSIWESLMFKHCLIAFAAIAALLGVAVAAPSFQAGTYKASANGIHDPVTLEVTFSKDRIEAVKVVDQHETLGIGSMAVEVLPGRIVQAQSPKVDAVTGASITSAAIRNAVADCVKQAGVDPALLVPLAVKKSAKNVNLTTDLVVVGGGGAGMSATIRARMNGLNVVLVEKMPFIGGAASISGGQVVAQVGSRNDSVEAMIKDFRANGTNLAATVSHYNGFVKAGKDADFDRPVQYMKAEIAAKGPYYIVEQKPRFATTMGGVMGDDSPAGANVGWALTSGRVAADAAAVAIKAGK